MLSIPHTHKLHHLKATKLLFKSHLFYIFLFARLGTLFTVLLLLLLICCLVKARKRRAAAKTVVVVAPGTSAATTTFTTMSATQVLYTGSSAQQVTAIRQGASKYLLISNILLIFREFMSLTY